MKTDPDAKRRWLASGAGALAIVGVIFALARVPRVPGKLDAPAAGKAAPVVEVAPLAGGDRTLREATIMHDQTPLFLPTERNVALKPLPLLEAGGSVLDRDALKLSFAQSELTLRLPAPQSVPADPVAAVLADAAPAPLHGLGRVDAPLTPLPARGGWVQVLAARTNEPILEEALPVAARPPTDKTWRPLEFVAAIEPAGLVGSLVLTQRSDVEEVERYFRNYLAQSFRIGERLPPGFYRIIVGP